MASKRCRKPNFSSAELSKLLEAVCERRKAVCTTDNSCTTQKQKVAAYKIITEKVNEVTRVESKGKVEREWTDIKERWMREKYIAIFQLDEDLKKDGLPPASGINRLRKVHLQETACTALVLDILSGKAVPGVTDFSVDIKGWRKNAVSTSEHSVPVEEGTSSNDVQPALDIDSLSVTELPPPPDTTECDSDRDSVDALSDTESPELEANEADGEHYSELIESNAHESLQDRSDSEDYIQGKRKRRKNFSDLEISTLLTEVNRHRDVVLETVNDRSTVRLKQKSWSLIQRKMQSVCAQEPETERTAEELREKWYDLKRLVLKTGQSGKSRVSVFSHTSQIMAILNGTFQDQEMGSSVSGNTNIIPNWPEDMGQSHQAEQSDRDCQPPQSHTTCAVSLTDTERDCQPPQSHTNCAVSLTHTERDGQMPYTDCDDIDLWDCFQDGTNQKRKRRKNFSDLEISTLLTEVNRHKHVLLDTAKDCPTIRLKQKIWSLIQRKMQSVCAQGPETERTVGDLRDKWYDLKGLVLKTGQSGKSRASVFSHRDQIMAILNGTFQDEEIKLSSTSSSSPDINMDGPGNSLTNQAQESERECQPPHRLNSCEVSHTETEADSLILEMDCEDSDSDESLQARPKQKRTRKQNYSHKELTTLLTEVNRHRDVLLDTGKETIVVRKKNKKWLLIQRKMQSVCAQAPYAERTAADFRGKWHDMKLLALKTPKQNGDTSGVSVFPYKSQVLAILNGTFHDEHRGGTDDINQSNQEHRSDRDGQLPQRHNSCEVSHTNTEAGSLILEMYCDESDSDESLQSRPKQKRKRKRNFSDLEISTLLTEVNRHRHVLLDTVKDKRTIHKKNKKWSLIQRKMQSVCAQAPRPERTASDLRDKWGDMKQHALKTPKQNGDTLGVPVFPYRSQILAILNGTFQDDRSCSTDIQTDSQNNINQYNQELRSDCDCQPPERHNRCDMTLTVRHTEEGKVVVETDGLKRSLLEPERVEFRYRQGPQQWQRVIPHKVNNISGSHDQAHTVNDVGEESFDLQDQKLGDLLLGERVVSAHKETVNGAAWDWTEHSLDCVTKSEPEAALLDSLVLDQVIASAGLGGRSEGSGVVKVEADSLKGRETRHTDTQHRARETQRRETQHRETQHRETQHRETQHRETQHRETQHRVRETQHRETQHTETQHRVRETQHRETQHRETQHTETQHTETQHSTTSTLLQQQLDLLVKTCGKLRALGVEAGAVVVGDGRMLSCGSERLRHLLFPPRSVSCATENTSSTSGEHGAPGGDWTTVTLDTVMSLGQQACVVDNSQHTVSSNNVNHNAAEEREDDSVHTDQWGSPGADDDDDVSGDERREESVNGTEPLPPLTAEPWSTACSVSPESGKGEDNVGGSLVVLQNEGSSQVTETALTVDTGTDSIKVKDTGTDSIKVKDTGTDSIKVRDTGTDSIKVKDTGTDSIKVKDTGTDSIKVKDTGTDSIKVKDTGTDSIKVTGIDSVKAADSVKVKDCSGRSRKRESQSCQNKLQETLVHKCADCGKIFESSKNLRKHEKTHSSEKSFACDLCNKTFKQRSFLRRHKERHLGLHKVQCEVCGRKLSSASIVPHMRRHTGEKPYKCDFCGRDFGFVSALKLHRRLHTGEKPFMCDICGKAFVSGPKMRCHRSKHTGEKPYVCDVCGEAYRYKLTLIHHHRKHTGIQPHTCDICGKSFAKNVNLNIHKRLHTGEKPYSCQECGESFHRSDVLRIHKRNHDAAAV